MSMIETKRSSERFWKAKSGRTLKLSTRLSDLRLKFNRWSNSLFAFACRLNFLQHHAMSRRRILRNKSTNSKTLTPLQNNVNFCEMLYKFWKLVQEELQVVRLYKTSEEIENNRTDYFFWKIKVLKFSLSKFVTGDLKNKYIRWLENNLSMLTIGRVENSNQDFHYH